MALFSQEKRHIRISTVLGKDVLLVSAMHGSEGMSRLFSFELSLISENQGISFEDIVGTGVTIAIDLPWGKKRFFNGIISRFAQTSGGGTTGGDTRTSGYRATMVPWFWLLSKSAESRIHQNLSVPDIVENIFKEKGFSDFEMKLQGTYPKREYCVQYRETHYNFISRLLEDEGIHYFFQHSDGKHKLVLADGPQANIPSPEQKNVSFQVRLQGHQDEDFITSLEKSQEIRPAKYSLNDFNFHIPNTSLSVGLPTKYPQGPCTREIYEYPGDYEKKAEGDRCARIRMEEEEAQITTIAGSSTCRAFCSGFRFTLSNYYRSDMNGKDFVLTSIEHHTSQAVETGGDFDYSNRFTCIPADIPFRPPRTSPKPFVQGAQTAIVVGPHGDEIYTDEHGRVKVQFHWDRVGKRNEKSSCWVRVSQVWAGAGWGAMFIPRIGHEVIVDFLEGDPDRPIVTGRVYNGLNKCPYDLPHDKTKSSIKSHSSPGGGGNNELRFEDKKGHEEVYLHGEKDWNILVKHNKDQEIGHNEHLNVTSNRTLRIGVDQTEKIGANKDVKVGLNHSERVGVNKCEIIGAAKELTIGGLYQVTVGGVMNETVAGAKAEEVGGYRAEVVGGYNTIHVGADFNQSIAGRSSISVAGDFDSTIGGAMTQKVTGMHSQDADEIVLTATTKLTLVCGPSTVVLDAAGITIKAPLVKINC